MMEPDDPQALLDALTRRDLSVFVRRGWPLLNGRAEIKWNWHLDALCHQLERVARGECQRLVINIPPRHGKSQIASSLFPAFLFGSDPTTNVVGVSYSNELSGKLGRDCIALMQSAWYRALFPRAMISPQRSASYDFDLLAGGGRLATSITGSLTGRGGDIVILDDVIKPDEAMSETAREKVNNWYASTLASRLDDKTSGATILVMQRLHEDDLAGRLLATGGFECLSLPAIAPEDCQIPLMRGRIHHREAGDILHPEREPMHVLEGLKATMGSSIFAAQYLQDPLPATGNMVRAEWLQRYDPDLLDHSRGTVIASFDTATKDNPHNDWSVCVAALLRGKKVYVLVVMRKRMTFPQLLVETRALACKHRPEVVLIEDQSSGSQLIQTLRVQRPDGMPEPIARRPELDKVARLGSVSAMIEAGQLLLPRDAPWLHEFEAELLGFPNAKFDDQVDALSQLMIWVRDRDRWRGDDMVYPPRYGHRL